MITKKDFFNRAVVYAKEKNYAAARSVLRNLLFKYPDDINSLLLYSIVADNEKISLVALKRILQLDPDHEIAFAQLAKIKFAPPETSTLPPNIPLPNPEPAHTAPSYQKEPTSILREKIKSAQEALPEVKKMPIIERRKDNKRQRVVNFILFSLIILNFICLSIVGLQKMIEFYAG